jgi:hypothetical protein
MAMGTINEYLAQYHDERLNQLSKILFALNAFQAEPEEIDELLPALFTRDMLEDDELRHYVTYLRRAIHRWQQRQLGPYVPDECDVLDRDLDL